MSHRLHVTGIVLALTLTTLAMPALAGRGVGVKAEHRQEVIDAWQRLSQDPNYHALVARLKGNLGNRAVVDQYLQYLPISPLEIIRVRRMLERAELPIPKVLHQQHERWKQLHPAEAKRFYGEVKGTPMIEEDPSKAASGDVANTTAAATVSTNRNSAYNFPIPPTEYQGEIQVSVNPKNTNQIVSAANTWDDIGGTCGDYGLQAVFYSNDGGQTWGYSCPPDASAYTNLSCDALGGGTFGSDPALSWNDNNEVFLNYMLICYNGSYYYSMVVARSADGGATWNAQGVIKNSYSTGTLEDKNFYLVDTYPTSPYYGRHYTCWDRSNNEKVAYSTNNGQSWTEVDLPTPPTGGTDLGCDIAVSKNGTVHVIWNTLTCRVVSCVNEQTYYTRSTNGGASWSAPILVVDPNLAGFSGSECPDAQDERCIGPFGSIAVDNSGGSCDGTIYATYTDFPSGLNVNNSDIWVKRSTDGGNTWSAGVRINDDGSGGRVQFHPFLAVDQTNGAVVVAWHDARNDSNNRALDIYTTRSTNCGVSFEANIKATQASAEFNNSTITASNHSTTNPGYNPNQTGEYIGVDAHGGKAYLAWSDTRPYFPSFTTELQKDNVGFAVIDFGGTTPGDTTPPAAPAGLTATGGNASVSLDWNDNTETDLAGYNVYRSTTSGSGYAKINLSLVAASAYTDSTALNGTTYYYVVTAVDTSNNQSANSSQASATPTAGTVTSTHVSSIVLSTRNAGGGSKYAQATVTIVDNNGLPVAGATVTGTFSGNFTGTPSAVTNSSGVAVLEAGPKKGSTTFSFCVNNVTHPTLTYDSAANVETCDSF